MAVVTVFNFEGYPVSIEYNELDIKRFSIGDHIGYDIWPILSNDFKLKVFNYIVNTNKQDKDK